MIYRLKTNNNAFFRQLLFIVLLLFLGVVIITKLNFFIGSFLGAITIYVVLRKTQFKLTEEYRWIPWIASTFLVVLTALLLVGLGYMIFEMIAAEIPAIDTSNIVSMLNDQLVKINDVIGYKIVPEKVISESRGFITKIASTIINTTYSFAANVFMMLIILYFMLAHGRKMEKNVIKYIPFRGESLFMLKCEVKGMIFSNAVGIPVIMVGQAIMSCLIYWLLGMNSVLFWGFITALFGLLPVIGTGFIWVPLGIYFMITGDIWKGVILILYGFVIISNTDNVLRIILMKSVADTHPLVVIFGVLLGIPLFGFWGIIFGPLLISAFILLMKIYFAEYGVTNDLNTSKEKES